jgi:bifunctional non-homologous end joining protein LigD
MASQSEFITLYFKEGSSDKVYQASLEGSGENWVVNFAFGRRGVFLNQGTKTNSPVPYNKAKKIYDDLVYSKEAKGYQEGPMYNNGIKPSSSTSSKDNSPSIPMPPITPIMRKAVGVNSKSNFSGVVPQLLNFISEEQALDLLEDDDYIMQEKKDGKRTMVIKENGTARGINKKGSNIGLCDEIMADAERCPKDILVDGEDVNCTLFAFDILEFGDKDLRNSPYFDRLQVLIGVAKSYFKGSGIQVVRSADTKKTKKALFDTLIKESAEGVVFKYKKAPYAPGRPASGGHFLKFKFYATASVVVSSVNAQRSVNMKMLDGKNWVEVGKVTIPSNKQVPKKDDVIEVRYLYAYRGGSLFQTVYLGLRDDVDQDECTMSQLKYKQYEKL